MGDFELPSNIRQIGAIADGLKIYMEDYVYTYLKQYAETGGHTERLAFLIGKDMVIDGQRYVFISGAVQGKYSAPDEGGEMFTDKSCAYCEEQLKAYFPGLAVVGWMQSQPGFGVFLNPAAADYHMSRFTEPCNVLFILDPEERVSTFYAWDESMTGISEAGGYFIYYDKNPQMQTYKADNKLVMPRAFEPSAPVRAARVKPAYAAREAETPYAPYDRPAGEGRKVVNMLIGLSAVLVLVCGIMGAGLVQNDGRIAALEKELSTLSSTYAYLMSQVRTGNSEPVFAGQEPDASLPSSPPEDAAMFASAAPEATITPEPAATPSPAAEATPSPEPTTAPAPTLEPTPTPTPASTPAPEPSLTPAEPDPVALVPEYEVYMVQQGDSLLGISEKLYGTTSRVSEIMELNGMSDPDKIFFGKELRVPKRPQE